LQKKERGIVREYLEKVTGYSTSQLTRLISKYLQGRLFLKDYQRHKFTTRFTPLDIALLVKTDNLHLRLNGHDTKAILQREYLVFGKAEYEKISKISRSHCQVLFVPRILSCLIPLFYQTKEQKLHPEIPSS